MKSLQGHTVWSQEFGHTALYFRPRPNISCEKGRNTKQPLHFPTFLLLSTRIRFEGVAAAVERIFGVFIFIQNSCEADLPLIPVPVQLGIQTEPAALQVLKRRREHVHAGLSWDKALSPPLWQALLWNQKTGLMALLSPPKLPKCCNDRQVLRCSSNCTDTVANFYSLWITLDYTLNFLIAHFKLWSWKNIFDLENKCSLTGNFLSVLSSTKHDFELAPLPSNSLSNVWGMSLPLNMLIVCHTFNLNMIGTMA